ncbi:MAG TPA: phosphoglycerate kinase, partial [Acidobacteriota bacterium]|nr:phosphoglycerate kinase [Acidobacteriota bacterium]
TSLCEKSQIPLAKRLLKTYAHKIVLPIDVVCAPSLDSPVRMIVGVNSIPSNVAAYDVGPFTVTLFSKHIRNAKTVFWNGPLGVFEQQPFDASTNALAKVLADASEHGVQSIIGGGDTVSAINQAGVAHSMTHISTGGGASLEFVQGNPLAALLALSKSPKTSRRR